MTVGVRARVFFLEFAIEHSRSAICRALAYALDTALYFPPPSLPLPFSPLSMSAHACHMKSAMYTSHADSGIPCS